LKNVANPVSIGSVGSILKLAGLAKSIIAVGVVWIVRAEAWV